MRRLRAKGLFALELSEQIRDILNLATRSQRRNHQARKKY
jgi:hypothetical protein